MHQFLLLPEMAFAGHSTAGGSNKVWAGCLACEQQDASSLEVFYLCVYGPYGARLRVEPPQRLPLAQAQALLRRKWREKQSKGYQPIAFASLVQAFVYPDGARLNLSSETQALTDDTLSCGAEDTLSLSLLPFRYSATPVKALNWEQLQERMSDPAYGFSEKVNGERCLLEFDGQQLIAYNRRGQRVNAPPQGALSLSRLPVPFVLDGERIPGAPAERYVAFDLLEWQGQSLRESPYHVRLSWLLDQMHQTGLLAQANATPTLQEALVNSQVPDLALLTTVHATWLKGPLLNRLQEAGSEGVIVRRLMASAEEPAGKYKFQADLDAFVYAIEPGRSRGSLKLGLLRSADQAVIAIGHVRAGLTAEDIHTVQKLLSQGRFPVFTVQYLPARTIGFHLVEPHTSLRLLRTDKEASECTTEQLGPDKDHLLAQAQPVAGVTLS